MLHIERLLLRPATPGDVAPFHRTPVIPAKAGIQTDLRA
jgi:hypothetical protein